MTEIAIEGQLLVDFLSRAERLWTLRSRLEIPLAWLRGVRIDPGFVRHERYRQLKVGDSRQGDALAAGNFREDGRTVFRDVREPNKTVFIELADDRYARLVVGVEHPEEVLAAIASAGTSRRRRS
jgi:hypothetical protein